MIFFFTIVDGMLVSRIALGFVGDWRTKEAPQRYFVLENYEILLLQACQWLEARAMAAPQRFGGPPCQLKKVESDSIIPCFPFEGQLIFRQIFLKGLNIERAFTCSIPSIPIPPLVSISSKMFQIRKYKKQHSIAAKRKYLKTNIIFLMNIIIHIINHQTKGGWSDCGYNQ